MSAWIRSFLVVLSILLFLLFLTPSTVNACASYRTPDGAQFYPGSIKYCSGSATPYYACGMRFIQDDGSVCIEERYFRYDNCTGEVSNPCPAGCAGVCSPQTCGGGAPNFCQTGTGGSWCTGYICGYDCNSPGSGSCSPRNPGSGVSPYGSQAACESSSSCARPVCNCDPNRVATTCAGRTFNDSCGNPVCQGQWGGSCPPPGSICSPATGGGFVDNGCGVNCPGTADCSTTSCITCGQYTDRTSCPGGAPITCVTRATTPGGSCAAPEWSGACASSCGSCPSGIPPPSPPPGPPPPVCSGYFCSSGACRQYNPGCDSVPAAESNCNGGAGCGGCSNPLDNGGTGCDLPGRCCLPGLVCQGNGTNSVCRRRNGGPCKMPISRLIYPISTSPDTAYIVPTSSLTYSTNPLNWRTDVNVQSADCTWAHDGLYGELYVDGQLVQHIEPPGYGSAGNDPNVWDYFPNYPAWPGAPVDRTCNSNGGCGSLVTYANTADPSMVTTTDNLGYHLPFTPVPGIVHTWYVKYHAENGNLGGDVRADNWQLGRFIIQGSPNPPVLICQAPSDGNSGDVHDICDTSRQGSPLGYGNASRYNLNALDGGPAGSRQPRYEHRYLINDLTTSTSISPRPVGPNNGANAAFSYNASGILQNGHRYSWNVMTTDTGSPSIPTPDSPPARDGPWQFLYDTSSPIGGLSGLTDGACYDPTTLPATFTVSSLDPVPPGANNEASIVRQIVFTFRNDTTGSGNSQDITAACTPSGSDSHVPIIYTCNRSTSFVTNPPSASGDIYQLTVNSTDNAGNPGNTAALRFIYKSRCIGPWLQTTSGDVHSNDRVNTPGGP